MAQKKLIQTFGEMILLRPLFNRAPDVERVGFVFCQLLFAEILKRGAMHCFNRRPDRCCAAPSERLVQIEAHDHLCEVLLLFLGETLRHCRSTCLPAVAVI